jgi:hypothetical protein
MPSRFLKDVINPWLIGADPEFAVLTPPDIVVPNSGVHAVNVHNPVGDIGYDHSGRVWELRPAPSPSAYVVTLNLWKLLSQQEMNKVTKFKWKSGALGGRKSNATGPTTLNDWIAHYENHTSSIYLTPQQIYTQAAYAHQQQSQAAAHPDTLGGHVHFGIGGFNPGQRSALNAVTTGLLNLDILPHKENVRRLELTEDAEIKYGHQDGGDAVRTCHEHVEYRCAPSWLDKPGQALAALTCYKLAGAKPSSVDWPGAYELKAGLLEWLDALSRVDVDAWILSQYIDQRGFEAIQADPASDFKPRWRCSTQEWGR